MYLITGLGNPGEKYDLTPHNAGFIFLEKFRLRLKEEGKLDVGIWNDDRMFESELCKVNDENSLVAMFQKPLTFMNNSGRAVSKLSNKLNIENVSSNFVLIHDDLDIPLGSFKIQFGKGPKKHNGVESVEHMLGNFEFWRVRLGVDGREGKNISGERYVLTPFNDSSIALLETAIGEAIPELMEIVQF